MFEKIKKFFSGKNKETSWTINVNEKKVGHLYAFLVENAPDGTILRMQFVEEPLYSAFKPFEIQKSPHKHDLEITLSSNNQKKIADLLRKHNSFMGNVVHVEILDGREILFGSYDGFSTVTMGDFLSEEALKKLKEQKLIVDYRKD